MLEEEAPFPLEKVGRMCEEMIKHIHGYVQSLPDEGQLDSDEAAARYTQEFLDGQETLAKRYTGGMGLTEVVDNIKHLKSVAKEVDQTTYRTRLVSGYQRLVTMTVNHRYEQNLDRLSRQLADLGMWNVQSKLVKAGSDASNKLKLNIWRILHRETNAILVLLEFFLSAYRAADEYRRLISTVLDASAHIHHTLRRMEYQIRTVNAVDLDLNLAEIYAARKTWRE
jgi:hypothetical protein